MAVRPLETGAAGKGVARAIVRARAARGYSQRQLAALGRPMAATALSRIERTVRRCGIDDFVAIATALRASPHTFLASSSRDRGHAERAET
ncbi:hypothetical protein HEK616_07070 [Streptomyces nigrescens]|uniref:HTH cro/C1-type domain-containing protein n=1 Tax=Streptomyces nigrescens TaxID=1920 RepID=A0ABM7ZLE4_STRNI|nr:helix-turn-helix transcriptional regulator [Streptomyces nigrescens]BDM67220.1 hypothetical protein HEK616_07070 [Streptomyces nigrescens]